jgi:ferric-dicitrate binding protein FerR (iron transport regulator)
MSGWDQTIFEDLISSKQFISWVRGDEVTNADFWNKWEATHPDHTSEFREAVRTVKMLNFKSEKVRQADIEYLWNKTSARMNVSKTSEKSNKWMISVIRVAAVLTLPLLLVSSWLFYTHHQLEQKYSRLVENKVDQNITITAPIGARMVVDLPDGSKAWLNSGSELTYPVIFSAKERRVSLIGEAYFKVQKNEVPFHVSNLGPEIKVYGTEFNVNSYKDEDVVTVALAEGKIALDLNGKEEFMAPGQVSYFDRKENRVIIENTDVQTFSSWRDGRYIFRDASLSAILRILQRQHNVNIKLTNSDLGNHRYNMTIKNESLEQILQLLSFSAPIKYNYTHKVLNPDGSYVPDKVEIVADKTRIIKTK